MNIRKILAAALSSAVLMISGCAAVNSGDVAHDIPVIVCTNFPAYDFARSIVPTDSAHLYMLLSPGMESHSYDPSAKDIVRIQNCDLFVYTGGESDSWVEAILDGTEGINTLRMMDVVEAIEEEHSEGMQAEHEHESDEDEHGEYDEHIWTSPKNAAAIVDAMRRELIEIYPSKTAAFNSNADEYIAQINELDSRFTQLLENEDRYFIFADRFPLLYFFREYGLNYYAAFPGCGSEVEPSAQTISFLLNKLKDDNTIKTLFTIELSNRKLALTLSEDTRAPIAEFHTCHNITADDFAAGETYVSLMTRNLEVLKTALQ